jgi:hypothetical protein
MSSSAVTFLPRWTKRVSIEEGSRDPLGLSRVSGMVTDFLLQGIITQTYRARYSSFYCWAIWHIDTEETPTQYERFAAAFQRRDTLFTLASLEANPNSSPVGVRIAEGRLQVAKQKQEVTCNFRVLPSNALGAFGQYYTGSIYELGLTSRDEEGIYHVSASGEALARAFHETILDSPYIKKKLFLDNSLSWKDFVKTAASFNLDGLGHSLKERDLLTKLFFSEDLRSDRALMRKSSLALLMYILNAYKAAGLTLEYRQTWEFVYAPYYYGHLELSRTKTRRLEFPPPERTCAEYWQYFCLHQFLTQALENLLTAVLDEVSGELSGLTVQELCSRLSSEDFLKELQEIHGVNCKAPRDLMLGLGLASPQSVPALCRKNQKTFNLTHPSSESRVLDRRPTGAGARAAVAVSLLAMLYAKWGGLNTEVTRAVSSRAGRELHAEFVLPLLSDWFGTKATWSQVLEPLVSKLILEQHDRIMYEKGKLDSWLHRTEGRIIKDQDYLPSYRSPRTDNSVSILTDLGLLAKDSDKQLKVTVRGNALLQRVIP